MVYGSEFKKQVNDAKEYGWKVKNLEHDWDVLNASIEKELDRLAGIYINILKNSGCRLITGKAHFISPSEIRVNNEILTGKKILIATGGLPYLPDIDGLKENAITSNEALKLPSLPKSIAIFGSGYIAIEFACIFNGFGTDVDLIYRSDLPLRGFDYEIRKNLENELKHKGINLFPKSKINRVFKEDKIIIDIENNNNIKTDQLLVATGRKPNTSQLKLEDIGVELNSEGAVVVDNLSKSNINYIYAIGDVTNRINLTPVALGEGHAFADREFGGLSKNFNYEDVPCAVFSQPPVSVVGLSEEDAINQGYEIEIFTSNFKPLKHTISGNNERSFMKLVVERKSNTVLGAHMIGSDAPEIMQSIAIAIKAKLTKEDFDLTIGIHPTAAEEFVTMRSPRG
jgi:glutathione reductase (NADPH)